MEPALGSAALDIVGDQELVVLKYLLRFDLADAMLVGAFPRISLVPLKSGDPCETDHFLFFLYMLTVYKPSATRSIIP